MRRERKQARRSAILARLARALALIAEKRRITVSVDVSSELAGASIEGFQYLHDAARRDPAALHMLVDALASARAFLLVGHPTLTEWLAMSEVDRGALDFAMRHALGDKALG